jgi:hypothetical protein
MLFTGPPSSGVTELAEPSLVSEVNAECSGDARVDRTGEFSFEAKGLPRVRLDGDGDGEFLTKASTGCP